MNRIVYHSFYFFMTIITMLSCISLPAGAEEPSKIHKENTGKLTEYKTMEKDLQSLTNSDKRICLSVIGQSEKNNIPIYLLAFKTEDGQSEKLRVLIIARTHGSEPAGMEAAVSFIRNLSTNVDGNAQKYLTNIDFYIIPCLNPDGANYALENYRRSNGWWDKTGRHNGTGIDINRDYNALEARETQTCVSAFNSIEPHVIIDLHEFSSIPVVVAGKGWWRAGYFDVLLGAGRHPDVYPPLSEFARKICEDKVFPGLKAEGVRSFYYPSEGGNLIPLSLSGITAADYFNLRNSLTFLIETAGYDQGEKTINKRTRWHLLTLKILLDELCKNKNEIIKLTGNSRKFAAKRETITLKMGTLPIDVEINGVKAANHTLNAQVKVDGRKYYSKLTVKFRKGNPLDKEMLDMPGGYVVTPANKDFIEKLMLHGIKVYEALKVVRNKSASIPAHAFYIPTDQETSAIIGYVLDPEAQKINRYSVMDRVLVRPVELSPDMKNFRQLQSMEEIPEVIDNFNDFMSRLLEKAGVEDKNEDN